MSFRDQLLFPFYFYICSGSGEAFRWTLGLESPCTSMKRWLYISVYVCLSIEKITFTGSSCDNKFIPVLNHIPWLSSAILLFYFIKKNWLFNWNFKLTVSCRYITAFSALNLVKIIEVIHWKHLINAVNLPCCSLEWQPSYEESGVPVVSHHSHQ